MRTKDLLLGFLASAFLVGCSSDEVAEGDPRPSGGKEAYLRVNFDLTGNGTGSRATTEGGYDQETSDEHMVSNAYFAIYKNGNWFAGANMSAFKMTNNPSHPGTDGATDNKNDGASTDAVIVLELDEKPAADETFQLVVYANIDNAQSLFQGPTLEQAQEKMLTAFATSDFSMAKKFPMTNSTYLNSSNAVTIATSFTGESFKETEDDATKTFPIIVHIERLAAKVKVGLKTATDGNAGLDVSSHELTTVSDATESEENTESTSTSEQIKFNPTHYRLNGTNMSSYYLKKVEADWNNTFTSWNKWNVSTDFRCFWAKDHNYEGVFGTTDKVDYTTLSLDESGSVKLPNDAVTFAGDNNGTYCLENTFTGTAFHSTSTNKFQVATHVLIFGQYVKSNDSNNTGVTFYHYFGKNYTGENLLKLWVNAQGTIYKRTGEENNYEYTKVGPTYDETTKSGYQIVSNGKNMSDVTLQFSLGTSTSDVYCAKGIGNEEYTVLTSENISTVNDNFKTVLTAEGYRDGWAYFAVPIEHFGPSATTADATGTTAYDGTGSYGVVRNHSYQLTINKIINLGTGIFAPDYDGDGEPDPIIPEEEKVKYYVASTLKILSWKQVNQNVDL